MLHKCNSAIRAYKLFINRLGNIKDMMKKKMDNAQESTKNKKKSTNKHFNYKLRPEWLKKLKSKDLKKISDIYLYFVVYTPIQEASMHSVTLDKYNWDLESIKDENSDFVNGIKKIMVSNIDYFKSFSCYDDFDNYIKNNNINVDNLKQIRNEVCLFIKNNKDYSVIFDHIRNSFAHGRFSIIGEYIIMEDLNKGYNQESFKNNLEMVAINAFIIIKIENMRKLITFIKNGLQ